MNRRTAGPRLRLWPMLAIVLVAVGPMLLCMGVVKFATSDSPSDRRALVSVLVVGTVGTGLAITYFWLARAWTWTRAEFMDAWFRGQWGGGGDSMTRRERDPRPSRARLRKDARRAAKSRR